MCLRVGQPCGGGLGLNHKWQLICSLLAGRAVHWGCTDCTRNVLSAGTLCMPACGACSCCASPQAVQSARACCRRKVLAHWLYASWISLSMHRLPQSSRVAGHSRCFSVQELVGSSQAPACYLPDSALPDLPSLDDLLLGGPLPDLDWVGFPK